MSVSPRRRSFEAALLIAATVASLATSVAPPSEGGASYSDWIRVDVRPMSSVSFRARTDWDTVLALDVEPHGLIVLEGTSPPTTAGLTRLPDAELTPGTEVTGVGRVLEPDSGSGLYEVDPDDEEQIVRHVDADPLDSPGYEAHFTLWNGSNELVGVRVRAGAIFGPKPDAPSLRLVDVP